MKKTRNQERFYEIKSNGVKLKNNTFFNLKNDFETIS